MYTACIAFKIILLFTTFDILQSQSGCTWAMVDHTVYYGGLQISSANTEAACKTACVSYTGCTGVDFNAVAVDGQKCWLSGSWSTGSSDQSPGITHYELTRSPDCTLTTTTRAITSPLTISTSFPISGATTKTTSFTSDACWQLFENMHILGSVLFDSATTEDSCKAVCIRYAGCTGVDWNPNVLPGEQCWLIGPWNTGGNNSVPDIRHWMFARSTDCLTSEYGALGCTSDQLDLVFIIDSSESLTRADLASMFNFLDNIVSSLPIGPHGVQVAVVSFSSAAKVNFRLTNYTTLPALKEAISNLQFDLGITNLNAALNATLFDIFAPGNGQRPGAKRIAIIISDGADNFQTQFTIGTAEACKNASIRLIAVGVSDRIDSARLIQIASSPDGVYYCSSYTDLTNDSSFSTFIRSTIYCDTSTTQQPSPTTVPVLVTDVYPLCGPVAGGTELTVTGVRLNRTSVDILLYSNKSTAAFVSMRFVRSDYNTLVSTTRPFNGTLNGNDNIMSVVVKFSDGNSINTGRFFEYHDNPFVGAIFPLTHPLHGGSVVTVTGGNIDCVSHPVIVVTVVLSASQCNGYEFGNSTKSTELRTEANCSVLNSTMLICTMPAVPLPDNFLQSLLNGTVQSSSVNTSNCSSLLSSDGRQQADIYIGLQFDGFTYHNNLSQFTFLLCQPVFRPNLDIIEVDTDQNEYIDVKGDKMARGCLLSSYRVTVGQSVCGCTSLTDNRLTCQLPQDIPQKSPDDTFCNKDTMALLVYVENRGPYFAACVRYNKPGGVNKALAIGLGVGLGGGVLLIIIAVIIIVVVVKSRRSKLLKCNDYQNDSSNAVKCDNHTYDELDQDSSFTPQSDYDIVSYPSDVTETAT